MPAVQECNYILLASCTFIYAAFPRLPRPFKRSSGKFQAFPAFLLTIHPIAKEHRQVDGRTCSELHHSLVLQWTAYYASAALRPFFHGFHSMKLPVLAEFAYNCKSTLTHCTLNALHSPRYTHSMDETCSKRCTQHEKLIETLFKGGFFRWALNLFGDPPMGMLVYNMHHQLRLLITFIHRFMFSLPVLSSFTYSISSFT